MNKITDLYSALAASARGYKTREPISDPLQRTLRYACIGGGFADEMRQRADEACYALDGAGEHLERIA